MTASIAAALLRLFTGSQARWDGCAPVHNQRIYFANHTSNLDFVLLWSSLPGALREKTRPIAAHDYWTASRFREALANRIFRAVLIERKRVTRANNPLAPMLAAIDDGDSLIIFPEGGRALDGSLGEFKSGLYHLGKERSEIELVPVWIDNLSRVLPKGEILPLPLLCSVTFGKPIKVKAEEDKHSFLQRARAAVLSQRGNVS